MYYTMLFSALLLQVPGYNPTDYIPVESTDPQYPLWYIIGLLFVAVLMLAGGIVYLMKNLLETKNSTIDREVERSKHIREEYRINENAMRDLLQAVNNTLEDINRQMKNTADQVDEVKRNTKATLDEVDRMSRRLEK